MAGALEGITIIELAGIGPTPFAGMMLADHGARVIQIDRPGEAGPSVPGRREVINRNRELLIVDLKTPEGRARVRTLAREADGLIEGFRPGVLERLGLSPEVLLEDNPQLVIGRMTGWGQEGPLAQCAGHDINYIALSGALHTFGRKGDKPTFPVNVVGDYGGGGMMLAFGMLAGILYARTTGKGQVVDCAMVDGSAVLSTMTYNMFGLGMWQDERGVNVLDGGAPYYEVYETADGKYVSLGPIEERFYDQLLEKLGIRDDGDLPDRNDPQAWSALKQRFEEIFRTKTRDEWSDLLEGSDCCFAPVLGLAEAPGHPHNAARQSFIELGGIVQPAPAPRFSDTPAPPARLMKR